MILRSLEIRVKCFGATCLHWRVPREWPIAADCCFVCSLDFFVDNSHGVDSCHAHPGFPDLEWIVLVCGVARRQAFVNFGGVKPDP